MEIPLSGPVMLDGATGTQLLRHGAPRNGCLEQWTLEHPQVLAELQRAYLAAGSQVILTPTFGANAVRLESHGLSGQVDWYNRSLAEMTRSAVGGQALVAGDIGPLGLWQEPFGVRVFEHLVDIYTEQAAALAAADVDLFLIETMTAMAEARAAVLAVRRVSQKPIWVCFTCDDNGRTPMGTDVLAALIVMQGMGVSAFGLNCVAEPEALAEQLERIGPYASIPLIAKPSAGLPQGGNYAWGPGRLAGLVPRMAEAGVRIFGGCCGTGPEHITALAQAAAGVDFSRLAAPEKDPDVIPCASEREARFITPDVDVGEVIECSPDLMEDILEAEEKCPQGALKIAILEEDDVDIFAENQYAVRDALCLSSDVPELLEAALRVYQGRAFWDGTEELEPEFLDQMRRTYGLVLL